MTNKPIYKEIQYREPLTVFSIFAEDEYAVFLDSALKDERLGRFSYIAVDPFLKLKSKNGSVVLGDDHFDGNPFDILEQLLEKYHLDAVPELPVFQTGTAGYFSYDLHFAFSAARA